MFSYSDTDLPKLKGTMRGKKFDTTENTTSYKTHHLQVIPKKISEVSNCNQHKGTSKCPSKKSFEED
jgi:hypothetical protein